MRAASRAATTGLIGREATSLPIWGWTMPASGLRGRGWGFTSIVIRFRIEHREPRLLGFGEGRPHRHAVGAKERRCRPISLRCPLFLPIGATAQVMPPEVAGGFVVPLKDHGVFQTVALIQKNLVNRAQNVVDKFGWLANLFGWFTVNKSLCFFLSESATRFQSIARTKKHRHMRPPSAKPISSGSLQRTGESQILSPAASWNNPFLPKNPCFVMVCLSFPLAPWYAPADDEARRHIHFGAMP
jgi:hypothetical protein